MDGLATLNRSSITLAQDGENLTQDFGYKLPVRVPAVPTISLPADQPVVQ